MDIREDRKLVSKHLWLIEKRGDGHGPRGSWLWLWSIHCSWYSTRVNIYEDNRMKRRYQECTIELGRQR